MRERGLIGSCWMSVPDESSVGRERRGERYREREREIMHGLLVRKDVF